MYGNSSAGGAEGLYTGDLRLYTATCTGSSKKGACGWCVGEGKSEKGEVKREKGEGEKNIEYRTRNIE